MVGKLLLLSFFTFVSCGRKPEPAKNIALRSFIPDPSCNKSFFNFGNLKIVKTVGQPRQLSGRVQLLEDIDGHSLKIYTLVNKILPTGDVNVDAHYDSICHMLEVGTIFTSTTVYPRRSKCPLRKGTYQVSNLTVVTLVKLTKGSYFVTAEIVRTSSGATMCAAKVMFDIEG